MGNVFSENTEKALIAAKTNAYLHKITDYDHYETIHRYEMMCDNLDCLIYKPTRNELADISNAVNACRSLIHLNLSKLRLNDDDFTFFIRRLKPEKVSFKRLTLSENELSDESATELCNFMNVNRTLTNVDLSYNKITDMGLAELGVFILSKDIVLKSINLDCNRYTATGTTDFLRGMFYNEKITFLSIKTFDKAQVAYRDMFISRNNSLKAARLKQHHYRYWL